MGTEGKRVVVCGGGLAGMTAAVSALEVGATVTLLEKAPRIGGSTALSGGRVWTYREFSKIEEVAQLGNPLLQRLIFDTFEDSRRWLAEQGALLTNLDANSGHKRVSEVDPSQVLSSLKDRLIQDGATICCETALDSLLERDGIIVGLRAVCADGSLKEFEADAVVLATGGFQGNPELLGRYLTCPVSNLYLRANPFSTGDALQAAMSIGAALTPGLDTFYGHSMSAPPATCRAAEFTESSLYYGPQSVALNMRGERFANEAGGAAEEYLNQRLAQQEGGRGFYIIDQEIASRDAKMRPVVDGVATAGVLRTQVVVDRAVAQGAPVVVAGTLEALAEGLGEHGLPPARVIATLREFNEACASGTTRRLSPPRIRNPFPIAVPPFIAVGVKASITFTIGGLAVDESMSVLRRAGTSSMIAQSISDLSEYRETPIAGLYAAGCDVGNVHHGGYIGGLATALTTGRAAGRAAASKSA